MQLFYKDQANFHTSQTWQIVLILKHCSQDMLYIINSVFDVLGNNFVDPLWKS